MKLLSAALLGVLVPAIASAQNNGVFIQAGPVLDVLQASKYETLGVSASLGLGTPSGGVFIGPGDEQTQSTQERFAPGGTLAVGVFISSSVSLRAETSFHGDHVSTAETTSATEQTRSLTRNSSGVTDLSVAAAWHQGSGRRVGISYLAGLVFRRQTDDTFSSFTYPALSVSSGPGLRQVQVVTSETQEDNFRVVIYDRGIMAGMDLSVNLTDHIAVVPQVRLVSAAYGWNVRPGVSLRWRP